MVKKFLLSTTGTAPGSPSKIIIDDLGAREFLHPITDLDLFEEFIISEVKESDDLQIAIDAGYVTVKDEYGNIITNVDQAGRQNSIDVLYTPTDIADWGSPDPVQVKEALDSIAKRTSTLEDTNFFDKDEDSAIDIDYLPSNSNNWSSPLVENVDNALDELALRLTLVESVADSDELIKISANDSAAGYLEDKLIGTTNKIVLSVNDEGDNETYQINIGSDIFDKAEDDGADITYIPTDPSDWGSPDPSDVSSALDEAADRIALLETDPKILWSWEAAHDKKATDIFLSSNGLFTNVTPWVTPVNATIIAISAASSASGTWDLNIYVNGSDSGSSLSIVSSDKGYSVLSLDINAGDEISLFVNGTSIEDPRSTIWIRER